MINSIILSRDDIYRILIEKKELELAKKLEKNNKTLKRLENFLSIFKEATDVLKMDRVPSLYKVLPIYYSLKKHLENVRNDDEEIQEI